MQFDQATLKEVAEGARDRDVSDYVNAITSRVRSCILSGPKMTQWNNDSQVLWKSRPPPVAMIESLLAKYEISDPFLSKLIDDYRFFLANDAHRYERFWADRDSWPIDNSDCSFENAR